MTHTLHNLPAGLRPAALALAGMLMSNASWAATFVVTDAGDAPDLVPGDGLCANSGAACSLRAAIQEVNTLRGAHTIHFNIATGGPGIAALIAPTTPLPAVRTPITIDGYTQPGSSANTASVGNNAVINVRIDGKNVSESASGLGFFPGSSNSALRGVAVTGFKEHGVLLLGHPGPASDSPKNVTIAGNFIGTDGSGPNVAELPALLDLVAELDPTLWSVFFLVPTGRVEGLRPLSDTDVEQVLWWLHEIAEAVPVKTTEAPQFRRVAIQRAADPPEPAPERELVDDLRRRPRPRPPRGVRPAGRIRPPLDVNAGRGFAFVDHTGTVQPSGFPAAGGRHGTGPAVLRHLPGCTPPESPP